MNNGNFMYTYIYSQYTVLMNKLLRLAIRDLVHSDIAKLIILFVVIQLSVIDILSYIFEIIFCHLSLLLTHFYIF